MSDHDNTCSSFWKGLLIGGLLGAAAGLLLAPKSGKELRADIKRKSSEAVDEAKRIFTEARAKTDAIMEEARRKAAEVSEIAKTEAKRAKRAVEVGVDAARHEYSKSKEEKKA